MSIEEKGRAEGDKERIIWAGEQVSRGHGQGHPSVTAASTPAAQGLFVSGPKRHRGALSENEREAIFVFFFSLSKYPRL